MKHDNEERRWVMPRYTDYSKPAYFYRLFHEGRPFLNAINGVAGKLILDGRWKVERPMFSFEFHKAAFDAGVREMAQKTIIKPVICDEILADDLFLGTPAGKPATTVDPLDGVW